MKEHLRIGKQIQYYRHDINFFSAVRGVLEIKVCVQNDEMVVPTRSRYFISHASSNICEYDCVVTRNLLHLFNAIYKCHALKCALNLSNIPNRQASKQSQATSIKNFPILPNPRAIQKALLKH
jgi:hypothetical protein